jgi:hypothetical protein
VALSESFPPVRPPAHRHQRCEQNGLWVDFEFAPAADTSTPEAEEKTGDKAREEPREKTREKILGLIREVFTR